MNVIDTIMIGIALAMDAFGVSIAVGVSKGICERDKIQYIISFSAFQCAFCFLGGLVGKWIDSNVIKISTEFAGTTIMIVGFFMIIDGIKDRDEIGRAHV